MEVNNNIKLEPAKVDEARKTRLPLRPISDAYKKVNESSDQVEVSSKGKLLFSLRDSYKKLEAEGAAAKLEETRTKIEEGKKLSPEEIVHGILRGTLFQPN